MTAGKIIFLINVVGVIACWLFEKYSNKSGGENSMSAELPTIFIGFTLLAIDLVFFGVKIARWLLA